ncbi:MAG: response regulator transcription factor [Chloroflexota bacterium]|nr:response regulator transcription factor [Chloroflexota bacterium]
MQQETILVVEDDSRMLRLESRLLQLEGYTVIAASDSPAALQALEENEVALVLLDLMMPGTDGYGICQRIRDFSPVPIVMVTARGSDEDKVKGFMSGADDYVTKPFNPEELALRVKAVLRRCRPQPELARAMICCGDLTLDLARRSVWVGRQKVMLTRTEYCLLTYLFQHAGYLLTTNEILRHVWGDGYEDNPTFVHVYVSKLRQKLGDDARDPKYILTRPGIGYMACRCSQQDSALAA